MKVFNNINECTNIGILIFDGFITNEVLAPLDIFSKKNSIGKQYFNVYLIAKENKSYTSDEGLKVLPHFTFASCPLLNVLVIPGSMNPDNQIKDEQIIEFIQKTNNSAEYIMSHCSGAFILGASKIACGKRIVTYCGGGEALQKKHPELHVQDDQNFTTVCDGRFISSNGNLVSYLSSLVLIEILTSVEHRKFVEDQILIKKLQEHEW